MATKAAHKRLTREYQTIQANPPPYIVAHPSEANILEWHYILTGPPDTPYHGGQYWGTLVFPPEYPFAPPAIRMHTPSGRFQTSTRLCLSISDFHPKSFNPAWSVSTILIGLMSFMNSEEMTAGSLSASMTERKWHAARSRWWNSTGGGSASAPSPGNNISKSGPGIANIKAGDGGIKFRGEWPDEDNENWEWIKDNKIDPKTGKILPDPEGEVVHYGPEAAKLRRILGAGGGSGGTVGGLGQAAREAGQGWIARWKWWILGAFVAYLVVSRGLLGGEEDDL
jgi:ubiquitin-conjugating enzyme E2 J2